VLHSNSEVEADYFMLKGLRDWIRAKRYLAVIETYQDIEDERGMYIAGEVTLSHFLLDTDHIKIKGKRKATCGEKVLRWCVVFLSTRTFWSIKSITRDTGSGLRRLRLLFLSLGSRVLSTKVVPWRRIATWLDDHVSNLRPGSRCLSK
jgi:hypothetical protein